MNAYVCRGCLGLLDNDRFPATDFPIPHTDTVVCLCPDCTTDFHELGRIQLAPEKHETNDGDGR